MAISLKNSPRRAGSLQGVLLILPITMAVMGVAVLSPVLPMMQAHYHDQPGVEFLVPLSLTLPALCVALFSPLAGLVVDAVGRRRTLLVALALYAVVGTLPLILASLVSIIVSRAFLGVTEALIVIASTALIGDYFEGAERERWLANQTAVASISAIFLFAAGGALGNLGWRAPFAVYSVSLLFAVGLLLWSWEPQSNSNRVGGTRGSAIQSTWRRMMPISLLAVFGGIMFFMMMIQLSFLLTDRYAIRSPGTIGFYTAVASVSVPIGTVLYRRFARFGVAVLLRIAFGLLGTTFVLMKYAPTPQLLLGCLIANQLACGILLPTLVVWAMARLPAASRGRGTGLFFAGWWIGQFLSPLTATLVSRVTGGLPGALQVFGIACLGAAAVAFISRSATPQAGAADS